MPLSPPSDDETPRPPSCQRPQALIHPPPPGIGREITRQLLLRPTTTVVATVRNPADPTAASLPALPTGPDSTLVLVQLAEPADYAALAPTLAARGITTIDVAVANAGAATGFHTVLTTTPDDAAADMAVNAAAPLRLFQTVWPLLRPASGGGGKMVFMSSSLGSIAGLDEESLTGVGYGMGKAALNFLAKKIAVDLKGEGVVVGILHPGYVVTPATKLIFRGSGGTWMVVC